MVENNAPANQFGWKSSPSARELFWVFAFFEKEDFAKTKKNSASCFCYNLRLWVRMGVCSTISLCYCDDVQHRNGNRDHLVGQLTRMDAESTCAGRRVPAWEQQRHNCPAYTGHSLLL